jgi:hypothetical protein
MKKITMLLTAMLFSSGAVAGQDIYSEHAQKTLEIFTRIIESRLFHKQHQSISILNGTGDNGYS